MDNNKFFEEILLELSYRSDEGYPDFSKPQHITILSEILTEWGLTDVKYELIKNLLKEDEKEDEKYHHKGKGVYVKIGDKEHPVKMSKDKAQAIVGKKEAAMLEDHDPQYKAGAGKRKKQLDQTQADLKKAKKLRKQGKTAQAKKIEQTAYNRRLRMEKEARKKGKMSKQKSKYTESVLDSALDDLLTEIAIEEAKKLAEKLDSPVCSGYQHNDSFPGSHPLAVGPLGYNGSKAAMELISKADVVLALGTRLNPFSTLPGYGIDYWPKSASIIQVDINPDRIGLTKKVTVGISGDAKLVAQQIFDKLSSNAGDIDRQKRKDLIHQTKSAWLQKLSSLDHEDDDEGTVWNKEARERDKDRMSPRQAWRAIQAGMPEDVIISSDIGNNCAIGNAYPTFEKPRKYLAPGLFGPCGYGFPSILGAKIGCPDTPVIGFAGDGAFGISMNEMSSCARKEWPAITMVIFRNYQWGAEKRNTTLWFDNNFVGTELDPELSYAKVADACGLKGVTVKTMEETTSAIKKSCEDQKKGITTFIEVILNQELGEPFRRDAMKKPVRVAGIKKEDMKKQAALNN